MMGGFFTPYPFSSIEELFFDFVEIGLAKMEKT